MLWETFKYALGAFAASLILGLLIAQSHGAQDAGKPILGFALLAAGLTALRSWLLLQKAAKIKIKDRAHAFQLQKVIDAMALQSPSDFSVYWIAAEMIFSRRSETFLFTTWPQSGDYATLQIMREAGLTSAPQRRDLSDGPVILDYQLTELGASLLPDLVSEAWRRRKYFAASVRPKSPNQLSCIESLLASKQLLHRKTFPTHSPSAEPRAAICLAACRHGGCSRASSRGGAGLQAVPRRSGECVFRGLARVWRLRPSR